MLNLKPPSSVENYSHVYSGDPALDTEAEGFDLDKYNETGDAKFLAVKSGKSPCIFTLRHLSPREVTYVAGERERTKSIAETTWLCCAMALVECNHPDLSEIKHTVDQRGFKVVIDEQMDALGSVPYLVTELGTRAWIESQPKKQ